MCVNDSELEPPLDVRLSPGGGGIYPWATASVRPRQPQFPAWVLFLLLSSSLPLGVGAQTASATPAGRTALILELEGKVEFSPAGSGLWDPAKTNQVLRPGDLLRTGERSRAALRLSPKTTMRVREQTTFRVPSDPAKRGILNLLKGAIYLFHRDKAGEFPVETPSGYAVVLGTEFTLSVNADGSTRLDLLDGAAALTNDFGSLGFRSGEAGMMERGKAPARTAAIEARNVVQWCLYYPGILDLDELNLGADERAALSRSLEAYRSGDLLAALALYPADYEPSTDAGRIYLAASLLAAGQVEEAQRRLDSIARENERENRLRAALRQVVAAVKSEPGDFIAPVNTSTGLATEWLAESYHQQSLGRLDEALVGARNAVQRNSRFGLGWARVAELEFSFARVTAARSALDRSLELAPRNAQAVALRGFLLTARNRFTEASAEFERALSMDGALGNAWLGRGLCRIHQGESVKGLQDLEVATTLEPQRAALRSYLGKAFSNAEDNAAAAKELDLAKQLDPRDPTAWLYSALLNEQRSRINDAVRDLEHSQALNGNRAVYRSQMLLDQDRAVRGANLANLYRDDAMDEVSLREAVRAVNTDYANYSAHLFLANTYDALRDPNQVNLRYETPWLSEYLVANLLAPVGAGTLSQTVSQQEYSKLFEHNRLGLVSSTEYLSRGDWTQAGAAYGVQGNTGFALEEFYYSRNGQRFNNDLDLLSLSLQLKQQLTPDDALYFQAVYYNAEGGDLSQLYDPNTANLGLRTKESQEPLLLAGYHHQWSPGSHTLLLAGRFDDSLRVENPQQSTLLLGRGAGGFVTDVLPITIQQEYHNDLVIYSAEAQQIYQQGIHTVIAGGRFQIGEFDTQNQHTNASFFPFLFPTTPQDVENDFERANGYAYYQVRPLSPLLLIGGVSYDWLKYPRNFRFAPVVPGEDTTDQVSPKAGAIWTPFEHTTLRGAYAKSLGGVSFDQGFQLEPTQVAGFNQAWRSLIPESVAGANSAARFETWGVSLEQTFPHGTYLGLSAELLKSDVDRVFGVYDFLPPFTVRTGETPEDLDYEERTLLFTANQLLGAGWSLGGGYRLSQAILHDNFAEISDAALTAGGFEPRQRLESVLHQVRLFGLYSHPLGFFGMFEADWYHQSNEGYSPDRPGDDFWQLQAIVGYRFPRRKAELRVGLLNITDQDYRLNPLNLTAELPRDRTLFVSLRFNL